MVRLLMFFEPMNFGGGGNSGINWVLNDEGLRALGALHVGNI